MEEVNKLGKILIVDDNEDVLFALNLLLEPYTEKIKVATTPRPDRAFHDYLSSGSYLIGYEFQPGCHQWTGRI